MEKERKTEQIRAKESEETIDLFRLLTVLWRKAWLIVLAGVLVAALAFSWATFTIAPTYSSTVTVYVNSNNSLSGLLSVADLNTAQRLVQTYLVLLRNRTTLQLVLEEAERSDVYTYGELSGMISAAAVNNTEVFAITVTTTDPYEAALLANAIAEVLPDRVDDIIDGSSMRVVDSAIPNLKKVGPDVTRYTMIGLLAGILLMSALLIVLDLLNDVIRDENHILQTYDIPILARVPDLLESENGHGYYGGYGKSRPYEAEN